MDSIEIRRRAVLLGAIITLTGCVADVGSLQDPGAADDVAVATEELNGTVRFPIGHGCSAAERERIRDIMSDVLVPNVLDDPEPLSLCLQDAILSPDDDASAEVVMARLRADMPTRFRCADDTVVPCGDKLNWNACGAVGIADESLMLSHRFLTDTEHDGRVGAVIVHEILHNHGFTHLLGFEDALSVNEQAERCIEELEEVLADEMGGQPSTRRSELSEEVELHAVGGREGTPFARYCPPGEHVVGQAIAMHGSAATGTVSRIRLTCSSGSVIDVGPGSGALFTDACGSGEVAVGVRGNAGSVVDRVGLLCARRTAVSLGSGAIAQRLALTGGADGVPMERQCPAGMAIRGVRGQLGSREIHELRVVCTEIGGGQLDMPGLSGPALSPQGSSRVSRQEFCSDEGVLHELYGNADSIGVVRVGGVCRGLRRGASGTWLLTDTEHGMPAMGPMPHSSALSARRSCGPRAVVGIRVLRDGEGRVRTLTPICADTDTWMSGSSATSNAGQLGVSSTGGTTMRCAQGEFVAGLEVRSADITTLTQSFRRVESVRPFCRSFVPSVLLAPGM